MNWQPERYMIDVGLGKTQQPVIGMTASGIGLHVQGGDREVSVTHLASGRRITSTPHIGIAMRVAERVASAADDLSKHDPVFPDGFDINIVRESAYREFGE